MEKLKIFATLLAIFFLLVPQFTFAQVSSNRKPAGLPLGAPLEFALNRLD